MRAKLAVVFLLGATTMVACANDGQPGPTGSKGDPGPKGDPGIPGSSTGAIHGVVKDAQGNVVASVAVTTDPVTMTVMSDANGAFALDGVAIGAYTVIATKDGYSPSRLPGVGVAAGATTSVSVLLTVGSDTPGTVSGTITDPRWSNAGPLAGVVVTVEGTTVTATTDASGAFTLRNVPPGPVFLSATAPNTSYLDTETREAVFVPAGGTITGPKLVLSERPSDTATYVGLNGIPTGCVSCHPEVATALHASAHNRSLTRIQRDPNGHASAGAFARMLNATLTSPRKVMVPFVGTISAATNSNQVTGTGTTFTTDLQVGDSLAYTPAGLGFTAIGAVASIQDDTHLTLAANATLAPTVASLSPAVRYGVARTARVYTHMLPEDANDIVAPAWPGVKATNPNYDANDPCIYGNPASGTTCAAGGTTKYADGQVNVYLCNLKDGVSYLADEYVQKFGGSSFTCSDGAFFDGANTPAVPMVHIDVIYGGQGDKDGSGSPHPNLGVFKQRFQGRLADVKAAAGWSYTAGKDLDSLTLPIQVLESGDRVNGGYKMNGYHPTEQKFPGESWTQRTRTFSHACAGCHATGLSIDWDMTTVTLPFGRDGAPNNSPMTFAAIKSYSFIDENITCEHCHGPGSEHVVSGRKIINPKHLTAEAERQLCGKCHAYDDATNAFPAQDYGFEFPWNSNMSTHMGAGNYVPGVYALSDFFDNWSERGADDEAFWDPAATGGKLYGQAHRQQYTMLAQSAHANNGYTKLTCASCHDNHTQYLGSTSVQSTTGDKYAFTTADFRNNALCLTCHAGYGPFASVTKDDAANLHASSGGTVTKNGTAVVPTGNQVDGSNAAIAAAVGQHMFDKLHMFAPYDPLNEAMPVGRCTSCHMPKVAKSGGYSTGLDANGNKALVEGDQASHTFDVISPWQSAAVSRGGPTFQSGYYAQMVSATNVKYDLFGYMPNSCSKCHSNARTASLVCPDTSTVWPTFWPVSEHATDAFWSGCFKSTTAP